MKLPQLAPDKAQHYLYGTALTCLGALHSVATGILLCAVVALLWEEYQRRTHSGEYSLRDAGATLCGAVPVSVPVVALWALGLLPVWRVIPWM